jgi:methionyl-tRNA formyltransferase
MATRSAYLDKVARELGGRPSLTFIPDRDLPPADGVAEIGGGPRVAFVGFPSDFSLSFLLALLAEDVTVAAIVTSPGAHPSIVGDNALSRIAEHIGAPLIRAWRINDEHSRLDLQRLDLDAAVMASFDQIVNARTLAIPRHGFLNIHPSMLPAYRGPEPVYWAIADGAESTGITLHRAVPKFDAGPVLAQVAVPVKDTDTAGTLTRRLVDAGTVLVGFALRGLLADSPGKPIDPAAGSYRPSVGHRALHTAGSVAEAEHMVRAGVPNMAAWAEVAGHSVYVLRATAGAGDGPRLRLPDGELVLVETAPTCGCHHDVEDCPHRAA